MSVLQLMLECVETGLRDTSALVRRAAVMAVLKLFHLDQQLVLSELTSVTITKYLAIFSALLSCLHCWLKALVD